MEKKFSIIGSALAESVKDMTQWKTYSEVRRLRIPWSFIMPRKYPLETIEKQCRPVKPLFSAMTDDTQENAQTQWLEHTTFVPPLTQLSSRAGRTSTAHYHCPQEEGIPKHMLQQT
jgi:hypothetical protein